jgi:hypothetical protein
MEKLLCPLWRPAARSADAFRDTLLQRLSGPLREAGGVHGARLAVADSDVSAAAGRRMVSHEPAPDAVLTLWLDQAGLVEALAPLLDGLTLHWCRYLVAEAEPLVSQRAHPSAPGERVYGMCQVVFMKRPEGMDREAWFAVWKDDHTGVAIETQATFGYRQNVIVRASGPGIVPCDAIVEEHFPPEAMVSDHAFYDTGGDEALLQARTARMMESCARFIDFAHIDVLPMSEYVIRHAGEV